MTSWVREYKLNFEQVFSIVQDFHMHKNLKKANTLNLKSFKINSDLDDRKNILKHGLRSYTDLCDKRVEIYRILGNSFKRDVIDKYRQKGSSLYAIHLSQYEQRMKVHDERFVTIHSIIMNDSDRTFCQCRYFKEQICNNDATLLNVYKRKMIDVLQAFSVKNIKVGYCQGLN